MQSSPSKRVALTQVPFPFAASIPLYAAADLWGRLAIESAFFPARLSTGVLSVAFGAMFPGVAAPRMSAPRLTGEVIHVDFRR